MNYTGAEIIIKLLENEGVEYIAGIPGGFNLPIYDALYKSKIKHILARHEQGAGFIAHRISRSTNKVGVCFATSGPGVTNILTAIADAKLDSIPLIIVTGQVPLSSIGTDAFQEVDTYGLTIPITKHNFLIKNINELFTVIQEAFKIASEGRPGPVIIDVPKNIQTQIINVDPCNLDIKNNETLIKRKSLKSSTLSCMAELINNSKKPIIYAGGGIINSYAHGNLYKLVKKNNIPICLSLMGLGAFPCDDELYLGMLGMHGASSTNYLINEADLILAFGVRFDDRATGDIKKFCPNASIIHIDIDPSEINKVKSTNLWMTANINDFLEDILPNIKIEKRNSWIARVKFFKEKYPLPIYKNPLHPANIIEFIGKNVPDNTIVATDVGKHQMWVAQRYPFKHPKLLLTSGGLGTMGFGLPAAIGASLINKERTVLCFSGDGSILMNIQELATLSDLNLNIKIIVFNNHSLGLVHQQQELFYNKHYIASSFISNPNFKIIAEGFGIKAYNLQDEKKPLIKLQELLSINGPCLINVPIKESENIYPMVPPGKSNIQMIGGELK